jgi:hypothetical protein
MERNEVVFPTGKEQNDLPDEISDWSELVARESLEGIVGIRRSQSPKSVE